MHGKIYAVEEMPSPRPPLHPFCRCNIQPLEAVVAGYATRDGTAGADYWIKEYGRLPANYINKADLFASGWKRGEAPADYVPGVMPTMGIYENRDGHLPDSPGRIWHEADINYYTGTRKDQRILWSNDGLVFVSYDHYVTFIEVI